MSDPNPRDLDPIEREILAQRTLALARATSTEAAVPGIDALVVRAGGRRVAIPLDDVLVASALRRLTRVPFAPPEVAGVTLLDGVVTPVFHLHALLGLPATSLPEHARVVLLGDRGAPLAVVVEVAESITRIDPGRLLPLPDPESPMARRTRGITRDGTLLLTPREWMADSAVTLDVTLRRDRDETRESEEKDA